MRFGMGRGRRLWGALLLGLALVWGGWGGQALAAEAEGADCWWRLRLHLPADNSLADSVLEDNSLEDNSLEDNSLADNGSFDDEPGDNRAGNYAAGRNNQNNNENNHNENSEPKNNLMQENNENNEENEPGNNITAKIDGGNIREYRLAASAGGYTLEHPYVPLRLLAEGCGTPLAWQAEGECALWGQRECAVVLPLEGLRLFYVVDGADPAAAAVYEEEVFEAAFMWQGSLCLPLSLLERLGVGWEYTPVADPESGGELGVIDAYLTPAHERGVEPGLVWEAAAERVLAWRRPAGRLLGWAESSFDSANLGRSQNIYLAAESLHGLALAAGEEFSFNGAIGSRTAARGFRQAVIFEGGRPKLGLGGGICQVSTTLYQAVCQAGLAVLERHPHSLPVSYAAKGQDATVAWGSLDLRWRNDSGGGVYLLCRVTAGEPARLRVELWQGEPPRQLPPLFAAE